MNIRTIESLNLNVEAASKLSLAMANVKNGKSDILTTPLLDANPDIFQEFVELFDSLSAASPLIDDLMEVEVQEKGKFGPRSVQIAWDDGRKESLDAYYTPEKSIAKLDRVTQPSVINRLRPIPKDNVKPYVKLTTASGLPFMKKKGLVIDEAINNLSTLLNEEYPAVLYTRTQEGNKTRNVWGIDIAKVIEEKRFYEPIKQFQSKEFYRAALNEPKQMEQAITLLMNHAKSENLQLLSIDFSAYDASVKQYLIEQGFNYFKLLFQTSYHPELELIMNRFINVGICTPDGIYVGPHGVPSGSVFTNEIDSIVQYLIAMNFPAEILKYFQIQGDDGLYACKYPLELMKYFEQFGLQVNEAKSKISSETGLFCKLLWNDHYKVNGVNVGIYSVYRCILKLCYLDTFTDFSRDDISGKDYFSIRAISILENAKYHPYFHDLCKFVAGKDKYKLEISDQGLNAYIRMREKQDGRDINFNIYQYGDYPKGIKSFESYKYIKSLF